MRSSSFIPYQSGQRQAPTVKDASDFLRAHDKLANLLPTVAKLAELQADCAAILPAMFQSCTVLSCESEQLVLATPNAAVASKLKQQLPKLQDALCKRGWKVTAVRLKVQVGQEIEKKKTTKTLKLPSQALSALSDLSQSLESTKQNKDLKAALEVMLQRHAKKPSA